jgi:hypothetical protein
MTIFKVMNQSLRKMTAGSVGIRGQLKDIATRLLQAEHNEGRLNLASKKLNALLDTIACVPDVLTKAVTPENIVNGFVQNGMVTRQDDGSVIAVPR